MFFIYDCVRKSINVESEEVLDLARARYSPKLFSHELQFKCNQLDW